MKVKCDIWEDIQAIRASLVAQTVTNLPAMQSTWVQILALSLTQSKALGK